MYFRDGTKHTGGMHKMPNGQIHSGKTHGKNSIQIFKIKDLSATAKKKAKGKKK